MRGGWGARRTHTRRRQSGIIRSHVRNGRTFERCFQGSELVQWLFTHQHVLDAADASVVGYTLMYHNLIHHVNDDLHFKVAGPP